MVSMPETIGFIDMLVSLCYDLSLVNGVEILLCSALNLSCWLREGLGCDEYFEFELYGESAV